MIYDISSRIIRILTFHVKTGLRHVNYMAQPIVGVLLVLSRNNIDIIARQFTVYLLTAFDSN